MIACCRDGSATNFMGGDRMIFIGYSSKDRYSVVEPILFHLKHLGLNVWYDFHDMFLGDDRYQENFVNGIESASYVIFIISPHFFESKCAIEELLFAKKLIEEGRMIFFPVFYDLSPEQLPAQLDWIHNIIYNEVQSDSGTRHVAYQIAERVFRDETQKLPYQSLVSIAKKDCFHDSYINRLIESWNCVDERSYGVRIGILFSLYQYLPLIETEYNVAIQYIYSLLQLNETSNHLIYSIFEKCVLAYCSCQLATNQCNQF